MSNRLNTEPLVSDLKSVVRDSEQLLESIADATGEKAVELRRRLTENIQAAREACCRLEGKAKEGIKGADLTIREHPYQSIAVALAAGVVIGALVARK